jgi:hypothetical protein
MSIVPEVAFTDLLRSPASTTDRLRSARAVRLRRRDDDDLVLMRADRVEREAEVFDFSARLLAELLHDEAGGLEVIGRVLPHVLPWLRFLPDGSVGEIVTELVAVSTAARSIESVAPVAQVLIEWRHTAEVYADPDLYAALTRDRGGDAGAVPLPPAVSAAAFDPETER